MPLAEVSKRLGVCMTLLKKVCRKLGVKKWPHRQIRKIDNCINGLRSAMRRNISSEERALFFEQIEALDSARNAVLKDPNATHTLVPVRNFAKRKGDTDGTARVHAPKQMGAILNKFYGSHLKKDTGGGELPSSRDSDGESSSVSSPVPEEVPIIDAEVVVAASPAPPSPSRMSPVSTLASTMPGTLAAKPTVPTQTKTGSDLKSEPTTSIQETKPSLLFLDQQQVQLQHHVLRPAHAPYDEFARLQYQRQPGNQHMATAFSQAAAFLQPGNPVVKATSHLSSSDSILTSLRLMGSGKAIPFN
jgi:hypothetical protein